MARNSEKAMTTLARWRAAHIEDNKEKERRPYLASECDNLKKAEMFRRQIIGEVVRKTAQIQNAGMGEFKLRELNDEINKLIRERNHWSDRIRELGGPDFRRTAPKMMDREGREIPGNRGYKYFGATRDLPGVRELFEQPPPPPSTKSRQELMRNIDADFYGYRDEDDGVILPQEQVLEAEVRSRKIAEWTARQTEEPKDSSSLRNRMEQDADIENNIFDSVSSCVAHVAVPTQREVEQALILRKKREILDKYVSEELLVNEEETRQLLELK